MFEQIKIAIETYNSISLSAAKPHVDAALILTGEEAAPEDLARLEAASKIPVPATLKHFYQELGSMVSNSTNENNIIQVFPVKYLLEKLATKDASERAASLGLIDMIRMSWGNDRYEFDEELDQDMRDTINQNYACFGWYHTLDNLESAYYLFYDKNGNFGTIFYHQDEFYEFVDEYLEPMSRKSQSAQIFQEVIAEALEIITDGKKSELQ